MGSGAGGVYSRTWGSADGAQSREKLLSAVEMAAGALLGDSVVELAEALLRVAAGEPVEDVDFPEVSDVAFDLALDALSAFIPGGAAATRSLGAAARAAGKVGKGSARAVEGSATKAVKVSFAEGESEVRHYLLAYPWKPAKLPPNEGQLKHIFRSDHNWEDTPANRKKLAELVADDANFKGADKEFGHHWYSQQEEESAQVWAEVRKGTVKNAGVNPIPASWDDVTGYRSNPRLDGTWRGGKKKRGRK